MVAASSSASPPTEEQQRAARLSVVAAMAFAGGALDAFLYVDHGRVFAGAMTGNVVLCGIALLTDKKEQVLHHGLPIVGFFAGIWLVEQLRQWRPLSFRRLCLLLELLGLLPISFLPGGFADAAVVLAVSFWTALQVGAFSQADNQPYSSTYLGGDMRTLAIGAFRFFRSPTRTEGRRQTRDLGLVLVSFLLGAACSAALSKPFGSHTLWLPVAAQLLALLLLTRS